MNPDEYVGTAPYLPPELKDDGLDTTYSTSRSPLSNKTDIWQLGQYFVRIQAYLVNRNGGTTYEMYTFRFRPLKTTHPIEFLESL